MLGNLMHSHAAPCVHHLRNKDFPSFFLFDTRLNRFSTAQMRAGAHRPHRGPSSAGFSLTELLVVTVIIVLLAALLLPALSQAKAQARSISCKNRFSQIGRAMVMYLADFNRYPPLYFYEFGTNGPPGGSSPLDMWADRLKPYETLSWTNQAWHCPTYIANQGSLDAEPIPPGRLRGSSSYSYNANGIGGQLGLGTFQPSSRAEREVTAPSQMYTVADTRAFWWKGRAGPTGQVAMDPWSFPPGFIRHEADPPHSHGYNLLFGDTHVALVKRCDYLYPPRTAHSWNRDNEPHPESWRTKNQWVVNK